MSVERPRRVADRVRRLLADLLRRQLRDPRIGFVTLTEVELSSDLRHAVVYVAPTEAADGPETLHALNHAAPFLRHELARRGGLRFTPALRFVYDETVDRGRRVEQLLERIRTERPESATGPDEDGS